MKNLFAALLCSVLLHVCLAALFYLDESFSGKRIIGARVSGKESAPLKISLKPISSVVERAVPDKVPAEHGGEEKVAVPLPATPAVDGDNAINSTGTQSSAVSANQSPQEGVGYYPSSQLTTRPMPLNDVVLDAPETLFVAANGAIILTLWIDELGEVVDATVDTPDIPEEITNGVITAFKQLRFEPGMLADQKVRVVMKIEVSVN